MATDPNLRVQEIGEQGLLKRLLAFCPAEVVGDDAALLTVSGGCSLVVTTDVLVDGVHFSDRTTAPEDAGWRAAAANLSDLAAMGATPLGITVGLAVPGNLAVGWAERMYAGLTECLQTHGTVILGGDVCQSPVTTISITALGEVEPDLAIRRATAQPGDAIVVTGPHGGSRAGLELLLNPESGRDLSADDRAMLIRVHQRPNPRLDVLPELDWLRIAGMDSSDGLADAIVQICRASGVGAKLDRGQIPILPALTRWVGVNQALDWALYGGEDFELVLCLEPGAAQKLVDRLGAGAAIVGAITSEPEVWLTGLEEPSLQLSLDRGFQHFG